MADKPKHKNQEKVTQPVNQLIKQDFNEAEETSKVAWE
jgi:hypothetical protein